MLVEAAWAAGPLHAIFVRIRAMRGHQIAAVAVARKLAVLCWHLLTKDKDYLWARPALVANKTRAMELQAGKPQEKGQPARTSLCLSRRFQPSRRASPRSRPRKTNYHADHKSACRLHPWCECAASAPLEA